MNAPQKYKLYANDTTIFLGTPESLAELGLLPDKDVHVAPYLGKKKQIKQFLDWLDKSAPLRVLALYGENAEQLWADFSACFTLVEAAGGLVTNAKGQLLVLFRRGRWDLPKGKIDPGETPEQAALREVREETGLTHLELGPFVGYTWHIYRQGSERFLKRTAWYRMHTSTTHTTPQIEEDIEAIRWVNPEKWLEEEQNIYPNLREIIAIAFGLSGV
ncbi:MAG: NUDIX domain-containing protein [Saprospiraceae bacterium]|nr:NUDIX domain-containing protein [Saprospiraceae bacterium]MDW8485058.1 NUDIX domain-containing protein [Saprospiraceae bacterium]